MLTVLIGESAVIQYTNLGAKLEKNSQTAKVLDLII